MSRESRVLAFFMLDTEERQGETAVVMLETAKESNVLHVGHCKGKGENAYFIVADRKRKEEQRSSCWRLQRQG